MTSEEIKAVLDEEFACDHIEVAVRCLTCANGTQQYKKQCLRCGWTSNALRRLDLSVRQLQDAEPVDETLRAAWWERQRARSQELYAERSAAERAEWFAQHNAYLESRAWRVRREMCLQRDNHRCQARLPGCEGRATQAHHRTYDHEENEPLFDLVAVCARCHDQITAMDRRRRGEA